MHMNYPFVPRPMPYPTTNYDEEFYKLKQEIIKLKERISEIENSKKTNYLKNDDMLHMMWTNIVLFLLRNLLLWYTNKWKDDKDV